MMRFIGIALIFGTLGWYLFDTYKIVPVSDTSAVVEQTSVAEESSQKLQTKSDDGQNEVTLEATVQQNADSTLLQVSLNTHSVGLDDVDFSKQVVIRKDSKTYLPKNNNDGGEGHHRNTLLTFKKIEEPFDVVGLNIGGVNERQLRFEDER